MFHIEKGPVSIHVNLDNGVYVFDAESGTGKTRLKCVLDNLMGIDDRIVTYTYNDKIRGFKLKDILIPEKYELILLDRYDLYNGDCMDLIISCSENAIVLIDCKQPIINGPDNEGWCFIEMTEDSIEVIG